MPLPKLSNVISKPKLSYQNSVLNEGKNLILFNVFSGGGTCGFCVQQNSRKKKFAIFFHLSKKNL